MDETLKHDVAKYLYPFIGNTCYHNDYYHDSLIKKYGKKVLNEAMKEEVENGKISDAFT
jgi:hypothetical protein